MKNLLDPGQKTTQQQVQQSHAHASATAPWQDKSLLNSLEKEYNEKKKESYRKKQASSLKETKQVKNQIGQFPMSGKNDEPSKASELEVERQTLVNAVIWSEILARLEPKFLIYKAKTNGESDETTFIIGKNCARTHLHFIHMR
ncbi:hypothetical protein RCG23_18875 [Neobacillus sp. PS3-34]|uniref:hypothetical protein n=1 Tax=Neobacillus sp. PS3-34 TaxID=3070678 RepID=UPI0027E1B7DA|nr:hypothetical protein [Neobacillus sp. PS3-34]WML47476.1 hypothetical protein RCG23_18875 [Neobacillus sp. PS3-34]